MSNVLELRSH